jgi:AraC-like DNA-binding protein
MSPSSKSSRAIAGQGRRLSPSDGVASQPHFFSTQVAEARRFYLNLDPPASRRLTVVSGGCEQCAPDYGINRRDFPYCAIEFVARGQGRLTLAGREHHLEPGVIFTYGPGVAQRIRNDPQHPLTKYFVNFVGVEGRRLLRAANIAPGRIVQSASPEEILPLFDEVIRTALRSSPLRDRICAVLVEQIILRIAESAVPPGTVGTLAFETYQRCRRFIEEHHMDAQTLGQIAERCYVDPAYLCRLFGRYDHQSPYQYLLRLRMGQAAHRLQSPGTLVKQVAGELGFSDPFHFSRAFRRIYGVSPRRFVRLQRPASDD